MTLLPIAVPTTPPNGAAAADATSCSGDFAALLALVAGTLFWPSNEEAASEGPVPTTDAPEPQPDHAGSAGRDRVPAEVVVGVATPVRAGLPLPPGPVPAEPPAVVEVAAPPVEHRPGPGPVPPSTVAVEPSPVLLEAPAAGVALPPLPDNSLPEHRAPEQKDPMTPVAAPSPSSLPWPLAFAPAEASLPADAPAATPVAPPAVPEQIVSAVVPLHGRGDGRHEVTLELRPEDLGAIRVEVSVEQQTVHLTLHAAEPATGRLLAAALTDLRSALADAGLRPGHVGVSPDGGGGASRRSRPENPVPERQRASSTTSETVRTAHRTTAGRLDLFL